MLRQRTERPRRKGMTPIEVPILMAGALAFVLAVARVAEEVMVLPVVLGLAAALSASVLLVRSARN